MRTGFGAEAHRVRGVTLRQRRFIEDLVAYEVGQRDFRSRNEVAPGLADLRGEQVFLELGQLRGAGHAVGVDDQRHVGFEVAVLLDMQVQHELRQRPMQARQLATQHGEARTAELGAGVAIEPAVACAELDVILDRELEGAWRAPAMNFRVLGFVRTRRHRLMRNVGNAQREIGDLGLDLLQAQLGLFQLLPETRDFRHQRGRVLALGLGHADGLGARIAQVLQVLGAGLDLLAFGFKTLEGGNVEIKAARRLQAFGGLRKLGAQQDGIKHERSGGGR